jgi:hypothetical protein
MRAAEQTSRAAAKAPASQAGAVRCPWRSAASCSPRSQAASRAPCAPTAIPQVPKASRLFQDALDRRIEDLSPEERAASRYMPKCAAAGCGMHFGLREITVNLTEEMAISWEASNKELYAASRTASA